MSNLIGELRGILLEEPSEETWNQITRSFDANYSRLDGALNSVAIDYVNQHLESWDPKIQVMPRRWFDGEIQE